LKLEEKERDGREGRKVVYFRDVLLPENLWRKNKSGVEKINV
jgi:hypothetical protein